MSLDPAPTRAAAAVNSVARDTLRRIAAERISPTPEAYARIYAEIAQTHPDHPDRTPVKSEGQEGRLGASVITRLLTQLDVQHAGITITRKREGLKRALVPRLEPLDALYARLNRLIESWNGPNAETGQHVDLFLGTDVMGDTGASEPPPTQTETFLTTSNLFPSSATDLHAQRPLPSQRPHAVPSDVPEKMVSFRLAGLLALLLKNIDDLTPESALVGNQIEQIGRVLTAPLTEKKLDEAERCVRALVVRQGAIKHSIDETKRAIREFAETLLGRLSAILSSTDAHATNVVSLAQQIASTNDLGKLSALATVLVADARALSANVGAERALLLEAREQARALQDKAALLEGELKEATALVRTDPLTNALNRRGFTDAYKSEIARVKGGALPALVLLDVDNFKLINERHGHSVGDEVLCALVGVLQRCTASPTVVARYGGEEFALLFPNVSAAAVELEVVKMQRALSDHFAENPSRIPPVTFSAGIAQVEVRETLAEAITRADRAMRHAKQNGKNCIVIATLHEATT